MVSIDTSGITKLIKTLLGQFKAFLGRAAAEIEAAAVTHPLLNRLFEYKSRHTRAWFERVPARW